MKRPNEAPHCESSQGTTDPGDVLGTILTRRLIWALGFDRILQPPVLRAAAQSLVASGSGATDRGMALAAEAGDAGASVDPSATSGHVRDETGDRLDFSPSRQPAGMQVPGRANEAGRTDDRAGSEGEDTKKGVEEPRRTNSPARLVTIQVDPAVPSVSSSPQRSRASSPDGRLLRPPDADSITTDDAVGSPSRVGDGPTPPPETYSRTSDDEQVGRSSPSPETESRPQQALLEERNQRSPVVPEPREDGVRRGLMAEAKGGADTAGDPWPGSRISLTAQEVERLGLDAEADLDLLDLEVVGADEVVEGLEETGWGVGGGGDPAKATPGSS